MKQNYEENKQKRIDYAKGQIEKNKKQSNYFFEKAEKIGSFIPFGQPILYGHHSQKRHESDLKKIDTSMRNGVNAEKKAEYYADRVRAMEDNTAISSDDPQAIEKLKQKLTKLESLQQFMKESNKCIKKQNKEKFLSLEYGTEDLWVQLNSGATIWDIGYPHYRLTNNNASIRRIRQRITLLERESKRQYREVTVKGVRVVENTIAGRLQLYFPDKPSYDIRQQLKKSGFKPCEVEPDVWAWQRFLNNNSVWAANNFLETYTPTVIPMIPPGSNTQSERAA
jgi:hypothetical protein